MFEKAPTPPVPLFRKEGEKNTVRQLDASET